MVLITEDLLRRRAEHNNGELASLRDISLAQQNIERIGLLNQLCRHLRVLHLQNNLICRIEGLNRLKELEQLNLAVNNLTHVGGLAGCESLARLDLTLNFIGLAGLPSLTGLAANEQLRELTLEGNPCTTWPAYRPYVLATLPQLTRLDGQDITTEERSAAAADLQVLHAQLAADAEAEAAELGPCATSLGLAVPRTGEPLLVDMEHIPETGSLDEASGEMKRPWCPATRVLEHREALAAAAAADAARRQGQAGASLLDPEAAAAAHEPPVRATLAPLREGEEVRQRNEGRWEFSLEQSSDGQAVVLDVDVGRYLDTSLIQADVQPGYVRLLIKGRLLQLLLPAEVRPDAATAQRSRTTGHLVLTMPLECPGDRSTWDVTRARPRPGGSRENEDPGSGKRQAAVASAAAELPSLSVKAAMQRAAVVEAADCGEEDELPPL